MVSFKILVGMALCMMCVTEVAMNGQAIPLNLLPRSCSADESGQELPFYVRKSFEDTSSDDSLRESEKTRPVILDFDNRDQEVSDRIRMRLLQRQQKLKATSRRRSLASRQSHQSTMTPEVTQRLSTHHKRGIRSLPCPCRFYGTFQKALDECRQLELIRSSCSVMSRKFKHGKMRYRCCFPSSRLHGHH